MTSGALGAVILWLLVAVIIIAVVVYLLHWLYQRSTKEMAFVRTGLGGESVVINGGALVLPIVHEITPVNLNVVRIPVARTRDNAVITRDRMRVDIEAEFFVRVIQQAEAVAAAASTLGRRSLDPAQLAELLSGKFVAALRSVASEMTLDELHENRGGMIERVQQRAAGELAANGLELESVAITDLDQTDLEYFNPANRFDAEGMTQLIETIEARRKLRNDIEQSAMVEIRTRNLQAEQDTLKLERDSENARLDQEQEIEALKARQQAEILMSRVAQEAEAEQVRIEHEEQTRQREIARRRVLEEAEISAQEALEQARIAQEQTLEQRRIEREQSLRSRQIKQRHEVESAEIAAKEDIERAQIVSERLLKEARIVAEEETEAREISRGEQVESARINAHKTVELARIEEESSLATAKLEHERQVRAQEISQRQAIEATEIAAREDIERARLTAEQGLDEVKVTKERELKRLEIEQAQLLELAEVERQIAVLQKRSEEAQARAASESARAQAVEAEEKVATVREREVAERIATVDRLLAEKNADTARIAAQAEQVTTQIAAEAERLHNEAENLLSEDARSARLKAKLIDRLEGIMRESVRPLENIEGIKILHVDGLGGGSTGSRSPTDEVIESALRYRAQAPLIDEMMKEIGVANPGVAKMGDIFRAAKDAKSIAGEPAKDET